MDLTFPHPQAETHLRLGRYQVVPTLTELWHEPPQRSKAHTSV